MGLNCKKWNILPELPIRETKQKQNWKQIINFNYKRNPFRTNSKGQSTLNERIAKLINMERNKKYSVRNNCFRKEEKKLCR